MLGQPYRYAAEKFAVARRTLMLPHPQGEASSIAGAFMEIDLGLHDVRPEHLNGSAEAWVRTLRRLMDTSGIEDPHGVGTYQLKARELTEDEQRELSNAVDDLEHYFDRKANESDD